MIAAASGPRKIRREPVTSHEMVGSSEAIVCTDSRTLFVVGSILLRDSPGPPTHGFILAVMDAQMQARYLLACL